MVLFKSRFIVVLVLLCITAYIQMEYHEEEKSRLEAISGKIESIMELVEDLTKDVAESEKKRVSNSRSYLQENIADYRTEHDTNWKTSFLPEIRSLFEDSTSEVNALLSKATNFLKAIESQAWYDGRSECELPYTFLSNFGACITLIETRMTWDEALENCATLGGEGGEGTLLQGISSQSHLDSLQKHFTKYNIWLFVGFRNLTWIDGGYSPPSISINSTLWDKKHTEPDLGNHECGEICLYCPRPSLGDYPCDESRPSLCQKRSYYYPLA